MSSFEPLIVAVAWWVQVDAALRIFGHVGGIAVAVASLGGAGWIFHRFLKGIRDDQRRQAAARRARTSQDKGEPSNG